MNLARYLSVVKYKPVEWKINHPFIMADKYKMLLFVFFTFNPKDLKGSKISKNQRKVMSALFPFSAMCEALLFDTTGK